ncbi:MAG TPA: type II toxin-antitoxin system death-on-curing family toxin [Yinghuangia sp.]|uniref:type II toxin-antitoxin system death-on-curing family toxin n=1 Tax=Yinghuangia sp. YIM S10712 TaxID=3436930 RepID=UPI002B59A6BF|nr:type II toxin-antitoxin system death-on-curing family toxin [Yinghuangia sp.]
MTYYPTADEILILAEQVTGAPALVRDHGLVQAACARPSTTVFGEDAYPDLSQKSAALMHSLARNRALVDGNKRTATVAAWYFLACNGVAVPSPLPVDDAERLVTDVATGVLDDVSDIAKVLRRVGGVG